MAKSTIPLVPSTGVLAVAIVAALVAAILVNVYLSYEKGKYELDSAVFLQMTKQVGKGVPIQASDVREVRIPKPLRTAFDQAIKASDLGVQVKGKKAPRDLQIGEFLWYPDFMGESGLERAIVPPKGYELVSIQIDPGSNPGAKLQPGSYVAIYGNYDMGEPRAPRLENRCIMRNVQVRALGGSTETTERQRQYASVQVVVLESQAPQLQGLQNLAKNQRLTVTVTHSPAEPEGPGSQTVDPVVTQDGLALLAKGRAASSALPPPPDDSGSP